MKDVTVIGSGPNGLAAALVMASAGLTVRVIESAESVGGGARTTQSLESGFLIDQGSAVHPMAAASPFFRWAGLSDAVELLVPDVSYGHTWTGGRAITARRSLQSTADDLGADGARWRALFGPLVEHVDSLARASLDSPLHLTRDSPTLARLGTRAGLLRFAEPLLMQTAEARALFAGVAAHSIGMSSRLASSALGLVLATHAHAGGWPIPRGGSQAITDFLVERLRERGVEFVTSHRVDSLAEVATRAVFVATSPREFLRIAGDRISRQAYRTYDRFRYGTAVAKLDATLDGPIPWKDESLRAAGTVHLGGSAEQIRQSERETRRGRLAARPFVLVAQQSVIDPSRAPRGKQVLYAYAHVPRGWAGDAEAMILRALEEHAPGVRALVRVSKVTAPRHLASSNAGFVGGDISSGDTSLRQLVARPVARSAPWRTEVPGVYLCSASTAPGPGVHGMAGFRAADLALKERFGLGRPDRLIPLLRPLDGDRPRRR